MEDPEQYIDRFIINISEQGRIPLSASDIGFLLTAFPVVGGGHACIVMMVEDMVVRFSEANSPIWVAERLIVAPDQRPH